MEDYHYMTIKQIVDSKQYPFTLGQMRSFLSLRDTNGLKKSVRHIGRCIYIRKDLFEEWIESQIE